MRFLVRSERLATETPEDTRRLYDAMNVFYRAIPPGVTLEGDWLRADGRGSFSVLRVPDRAALDRVLSPFAGLVALEVVEIRPVSEPVVRAG